METDSYTTVENLLLEPECRGKSFVQSYCYAEWAKVRMAYIGERQDLEQSLSVGLLAWWRERGSPELVRKSEAVEVLKKVMVAEVKANSRLQNGIWETLGAPLVDADGEWGHWNPIEPEDHLTDERAAGLTSVMQGISKVVGEVAGYILRARLMHDLSWKQISKRLRTRNPRKNEPQDDQTRKSMGFWTKDPVSLTEEEVEGAFTRAVETLREKAQDPLWQSWRRLQKPKYETDQ